MAFTHITPADLTGKGVVGLPDTPQLSALAMQQKFDEIATDVIVPKFNDLADELENSAGGSLNVTDPTTSTTDTLQNALDHIEAENALNTADRHNHANKATLDDIDATTKQGYDDLVTLMTNITGIDDVALSSDNDKIPTSKSVDDAIDTVQAEVSLNTAARHTHTNKSVLDAITGTMTTAWDALVTLFTGITAVEKTTLDNSATKIPNDKVVKDAIDTVQAEVSLNTAARHTHTNKATLDAIDSTTKSAYDSLVTNYGSTSLEQTVTNDANKIPSGAAVVDYVSALGGGDMLKATYDTNDDGTVDSADYATNAGHATTADSATTATSATSATTAGSATTADSATTAGYANSAGDSTRLGGLNSSAYALTGDVQKLFGDVATYQGTSSVALRNYAVGDFMIYNNYFYEVTQAIAQGGTITAGTNITQTTIGAVLANLALTMTGATSLLAGTKGLVPAPSAGDEGKFLKGDGTWDDVPNPSDMTGATSLTPGTHGLVPAPAAGDEDKVLKGDGTWGTAGDTATVRYDEATGYVQCKDSQGWFDWLLAGRKWNAVANQALLNAVAYSTYSAPDIENGIGSFTISTKGNGTGQNGIVWVNAPKDTAITVTCKGTVSGVQTGTGCTLVKALSMVSHQSQGATVLQDLSNGSVNYTFTLQSGEYFGIFMANNGLPSVAVSFAITVLKEN